MRVLIVDDHALLSESLRMMLEREEGVEVVGVAYDGVHAVELCNEQTPDVVLMDVKMPGLDGISATRKIKKSQPKIKVVILTSLQDEEWFRRALSAGADGYLLKDTPADKLAALIRCVSWGYAVTNPTLFHSAMNTAYIPETDHKEKLIKNDELQIIRLISEGKSNSEIAECMNYAVGTVKNKVTKIMELTGVKTRAQIVIYALKNDLV